MDAVIDQSVTDEIARQLGGVGWLRSAIGAKNVSAIPNGLSVYFPNRRPSRGNLVEIRLEPEDTYWVKFFKVDMRRGIFPLAEFKGIYVENLLDVFENQTGLCLRKVRITRV